MSIRFLYGIDGELRGIISAVVLSDVLTVILPNDGYALGNDRLVSSKDLAKANLGRRSWREADQPWTPSPTPNRPHSIFRMSKEDGALVGRAEAGFLESPAVQSIDARFRTEFIILILGSGALAAALRWLAHRGSSVEKHTRELALRIEERTAELEARRKGCRGG